MHHKVFTTAAIDNIDHNPSSTTAKESFYGTGVSLFQHPSFAGEGVDRSTVFVEGSVDESSQTLATSHATTLMCSLSQLASNVQLSLILD